VALINGGLGGGEVIPPQSTGTVASITSTGGTITVTNSGGPTVNLEVSGSGDVLSVFGRVGVVTAQNGDYTVIQVTGAAPLASPALTGTPTAPTAAALTSNTQLATTAYTDSAVAVETAARVAAEALKAPIASPTFTGVVTAPQINESVDALTVAAQAVTVPITAGNVTVTNNAALGVTITLTVAGAVDGQKLTLRFYDFSNVAQNLTLVGTENSKTSVPAQSNGSTTIPTILGFIFNGVTSKFTCVAAT
jgi:hypothetical protein